MKGRVLLSITAVLAALGLSAPSHAQEWPSRTVRIVMGFGAGGLGDIAARAMANVMSPVIGQPVIIENMPGAGGATAALNLARAAPDGHTMLWVSSQNAIAPSMFKNLPYDWSRDFTPIGPMATFDFVLFVPANSPLKTVKDVIDAANKEPDKFNFGSIATGTAQNLSTLQFVSMAKLKVPVIAHRTTGDVMTGLLTGTIQAAFETIPGAIGQIKGGQMRAIAVSSTTRNPFLPDVPTIAESGVPNYLTYSWNGMVAPAKTPPALIARLNKEITATINSPEVQAKFRDLIMVPRTGTPQELEKIYQDDVQVWRKIITEAKIQPN